MPIYNRIGKGKKETTVKPIDTYNKSLVEASLMTRNNDIHTFIQGIRKIDSNYLNNDLLIERMGQDSIISSAIAMWIEDTLQRDPYTKNIFHVEVDNPDDSVEDILSKGLSKELDRFLKDDLRMEKELIPILGRIIRYGQCPIKLDFADKLADDRLLLDSDKVGDNFKLLGENLLKLNEGHNFIESTENRIKEDNKGFYAVDWQSNVNKEYKFNSKVISALNEFDEVNKENTLNESIDIVSKNLKLTEDDKLDFKKMVLGRWFVELIGTGTNMYQLSSRQKLVAFMDRDYPDKYIKPDRVVNFINNTGKHKVIFEVGNMNEEATKRDYYQLERGEPFIESAMVAWQVLSALEDILLLTRMTRSILYRIFSVEVGNKGTQETTQMLIDLKNKIKMDETIDVRQRVYNSSLAQVPLGDSIFLPTREGLGVIDVKTVGGDVNLKDAVDLDYFKDKVFAGLRIPKAYFGFGDDTSGMMNNSLTQMDIRYCRTIQRLQNILAEGLKDLCNKYLELTRTPKALLELPDFRIVFTSPNSAEDTVRAEVKQKQIDTLKYTIDALKSLGINFEESYSNTRDILIKQFFGSEIYEEIKKDENVQPVKTSPENSNNDMGGSGMAGSGSTDTELNKPLTSEPLPSIDNEEPTNVTPNETNTKTEQPPEDLDFDLG